MKESGNEEIMVRIGRVIRKLYTGNMQISLLIKAMHIMHLILPKNLNLREANQNKQEKLLFIMLKLEKN